MTATARSVFIVPSRERPGSARKLAEAWEDTATSPSTVLLLAVDDDDPELGGYRQVKHDHPWITLREIKDSPHQIGPILNQLAAELLDPGHGPPPAFIGFMGDDHRPGTLWWDSELATALAFRPGVAYGDDLLQRERLPTACLISAEVLRAAGCMVPPGPGHFYLDDFWKLLGEQTYLAYLPRVIIEHWHPVAGKAAVDLVYAAKGCNPALMAADGARYEAWLRGPEWEAARDRLARLRALPGVPG